MMGTSLGDIPPEELTVPIYVDVFAVPVCCAFIRASKWIPLWHHCFGAVAPSAAWRAVLVAAVIASRESLSYHGRFVMRLKVSLLEVLAMPIDVYF